MKPALVALFNTETCSFPPCCPQYQSLTGLTCIWSQHHPLLTHCRMSWVVMMRVYWVPPTPTPSPLERVKSSTGISVGWPIVSTTESQEKPRWICAAWSNVPASLLDCETTEGPVLHVLGAGPPSMQGEGLKLSCLSFSHTSRPAALWPGTQESPGFTSNCKHLSLKECRYFQCLDFTLGLKILAPTLSTNCE